MPSANKIPLLVGAFFSILLMSAIITGAKAGSDPENTLLMDLKDGQVTILMRPDLAPGHVKRIKQLVREKFYDGIVFHRVIGGFMAQTGDPTGTGRADSQFFIVLASSRFLDGKYTVWGQVIDGMKYVGKIKRGDDAANGRVENPDRIIRLRIAADVK